jgi:hypothetical protein
MKIFTTNPKKATNDARKKTVMTVSEQGRAENFTYPVFGT